jgi:hypothetical protein
MPSRSGLALRQDGFEFVSDFVLRISYFLKNKGPQAKSPTALKQQIKTFSPSASQLGHQVFNHICQLCRRFDVNAIVFQENSGAGE